MPSSRTPRRALAAGLLVSLPVVGPAACGGDDEPTGTPSSAMSRTAETYLTAALDSTEAVFYYQNRVNWTQWRANAVRTAGTAQVYAQTYPAIEGAVGALNDPHSFFYEPAESLGERDDPNEPFYKPFGTTVASRVAYLWIPTFGGIDSEARADSIQNVVAKGDSTPNLCGWIIDLRGNPGGFWPAMLAGLSPLITTGQVGGFVESDTTYRYLYEVRPGWAGLTTSWDRRTYEYMQLDRAYTLRNPGLPIAILQGGNTASAGEIIVMAFKEPSRSIRTFGKPTYGVTSQPFTFRLVDRASVQVTAALMFDRQRRTYGGGSIAPDQDVNGPTIARSHVPGRNTGSDAVITAAVSWLNAQPSCAGTARADVDAPNARLQPGGTWRSTVPVPNALPRSAWPKRGTPWIAQTPLD